MDRVMSRRLFLAFFVASAAAALPARPARAAAPVKITVMASGVDSFDEKYTRAVIRPFEAQHPDIQVNYYPVRDSRNAMSVLRSQRMGPRIDVVILDPAHARQAQREGLITPMDPRQVPNAADLGPLGRELGMWALPAMHDTMNLVYAESAFSSPPASWREMWDPKYRGKLTIAANAGLDGSMIALTLLANRLSGMPDNAGSFEPGFAYLEKLGPNVLTWTPRPSQYWLVAHHQALLAVGWNSRSETHKAALEGYATTVPREGTVVVTLMIAQVTDRPNSEAAQAFINYSLSPQAQQAFAQAMFYAPSNQKTQVSDAMRARIPLLSPNVAASVIPVDWTGFSPEQLGAMLAAWQTRIMRTAR